VLRTVSPPGEVQEEFPAFQLREVQRLFHAADLGGGHTGERELRLPLFRRSRSVSLHLVGRDRSRVMWDIIEEVTKVIFGHKADGF
jgi:hypothetical protein